MGKAVDGDNARTYLETTLAAALDKLDAHDHHNAANALPVNTIPSGNLTITAGTLGVNTAASSSIGITATFTSLTSANQVGIQSTMAGTSAATGLIIGVIGATQTAAASYTCGTSSCFYAQQPTVGSGSTITFQTGLNVLNQGATGVTNAYGVYIAAQSGAATSNIGLYVAGGALAIQGIGDCAFGTPNVATNAVTGFLQIAGNSGTPTGTPTGVSGYNAMYYDRSAHKIWVYDGGWRGATLT